MGRPVIEKNVVLALFLAALAGTWMAIFVRARLRQKLLRRYTSYRLQSGRPLNQSFGSSMWSGEIKSLQQELEDCPADIVSDYAKLKRLDWIALGLGLTVVALAVGASRLAT
jgi:hypothetical protein